MGKVCLLFIYTHRFDQNIGKLESIYKNRFSDIFHLVPFYDGGKENVIPVFENQFYFQAYLPQSIHKFFNEKYTHYFFLCDDVLLHPDINENNYELWFGVDAETSFFPDLWGSLDKLSYSWPNTFPALNAFYMDDHLHHHYIDWKKHFLPREKALEKFNQYGIDFKKINYGKYVRSAAFPRKTDMFFHYLKLFFKRRRSLPYPLVAGYSDIFIIPAAEIKEFSDHCETTRQMRLWVEVAIPTMAIVSLNNINFEKDIRKKGSAYWTNNNDKELSNRERLCDFNLKNLFNTFKSDELYIHPVKLTKWKVDE